jgi:hypothetical protein
MHIVYKKKRNRSKQLDGDVYYIAVFEADVEIVNMHFNCEAQCNDCHF